MTLSRSLKNNMASIALSLVLLLQVTPLASTQQPSLQGNVKQNAAAAAYDPSARENVLIILDASYSMGENIAGDNPDKGEDTKMTVAKRTILDVLKNVPPNVNVGLRVYGHKRSRRASKACRSTQTLVPISANNRAQVANQLISLKPTGMTPISYSLIQAINQDFYGLPGKKTVILVSDGMETCSTDPCSVAVNMVRQGVDVKVNVVGFGIHDMAATRQLKCVALSTFGKYYSANTAAELADSLENSLHVDTSVQGQIILPDQQ